MSNNTDGILNISILVEFLLEHKSNICELPLDNKFKVAKMLVQLSDICTSLRFKIEENISISKDIDHVRNLRTEISDTLALFVKRSAALTFADFFNVNTNIDIFLVNATDEQRLTAASICFENAVKFRAIAEACLV